MIRKIVVLGPESTGKSTLCAQLADHYNTSWVKEYAREYLMTNGTQYTFDNLLDIAEGQIAWEENALRQLGSVAEDSAKGPVAGNSTTSAAKTPAHLFIDTDMYVLKVWCEFVFGKCHQWILNQVAVRKYDLYLLCDVDLPWVKDTMREYPDLPTRKKLYVIYKELMMNQKVPWVNISGTYAERLQKAIEAVDSL